MPLSKVRVLPEATSIVALPACVTAPEIVSDSSASRTPPFIVMFETIVPLSANCTVPPVFTVMPPERLFPSVMETGVRLLTDRLLIVELSSIFRPRLFADVITFATMISESFSLLFVSSSSSPELCRVPPPLRVRVFAPRGRTPVWLRTRV